MITIGDKTYVTADEIRTTEESIFGSDLLSITTNLGKSVRLLLSEVKWLYKYGGSGSGNGGGGGESTSTAVWGIRVTFNGSSVINDSIAELTSTGVYTLTLSISKHSGKYYTYNIRQTNGNTTKSLTGVQSFSSDDGKYYLTELAINCTQNGKISVSVADDTGEDKVITFLYITDTFSESINLVRVNGSIWEDSEILLSNSTNNLFVDFKYVAALPVTVNFKVTDFNGKIFEGSSNCTPLGISVFLDCENISEFSTLLLNNRYLPAYSADISKPTTYKVIVEYQVLGESSNVIKEGSKVLQVSIIPNTLFLSVTSDALTLSDVPIESSLDIIGIKPVNIKVFEGANTQSTYQYSYNFYKIGTDAPLQSTELSNILERETVLLIFNCSLVGGYYVTFSVKNTASQDVPYTRTIYWYVNKTDVSYAWYPNDSEFVPTLTCLNYFRNGTCKGGFLGKETGSLIEMSAASNSRTYDLDRENWSGRDLICSIGLLLNSISDVELPILRLKSYFATGVELEDVRISLYPNKIMLGTSTLADIFVPRLDTIDSTNFNDYHLITIYKRFMESYSNNNYYELIVYIDGIIEKSLSSWIRLENIYSKIELCPSNVCINYLEVSSINSLLIDSAGNATINTNSLFTDLDITRLWYTYLYLLLGKVNDAELTKRLANLVNLKSYNFDVDTALVKVSDSGAIATLGATSGIATMILGVLATTNFFGLPILEWMNTTYSPETPLKSDHPEDDETYNENNSIDQVVVDTIIYLEKDTETLQIISANVGTYFAIDIQGTSTRKNRSKNFELSLTSLDLASADSYPVFSPNFDIDDGNSFLPESSFTLKSDVVDSSHTNNTCLGDFINDNTLKFLTYTTSYPSHIKQCLRGFPVLLYLRIPVENFDPNTPLYDYYYIGIYNFNLGRKSSYNLGYKDAGVFLDDKGKDTLTALQTDGKFILTSVNSDSYNNYNSNLSVAEVLEKDEHFDFSLYDSDLLFNGTYPMFGDFVPELTSDNKRTLTLLVENISKAGGFIFELLGKNFGNILEGYHGTDKNGIFKNLVPDYTIQYTRPLANDLTITFLEKENFNVPHNLSVEQGTALLRSLLIGDEDQTPLLSYQSIIEYYTICMAFGLVDSVIKNLNLKSFYSKSLNGILRALYYAAFYDMDTALDLGNQSEDISYFAFSDYWYSKESLSKEIDLNRSDSIVYRDYYPNNATAETGYDVPSSYLFAIAKYAKLFLPELTSSPREIWASWRSKGGLLETASKFLSSYYNNHLGNTNELFFNLDYRVKYFIISKNFAGQSAAYVTDNFQKLTGRRLNKVEWWLANRFRILDAYFDIDGYEKNIYKLNYDKDTDLVELDSRDEIKWSLTNYKIPAISPSIKNEDIKYLDTVFTTEYGATYTFKAQTSKVGILALNYTPSTVVLGANKASYMFTDSTKKYNIVISGSSNYTANMYGSYFWTNVDNILPFIDATGKLTVRAPFLTSIIGSEGTISSFELIKCYALLIISLTSYYYTGNLNLSNSGTGITINYPLLTKIILNNTNINLTADSLYISTLDISNSKGSSIKVTNCNQLVNVKFGDIYWQTTPNGNVIVDKERSTLITASSVIITPYNLQSTELHGLAIQSLTLRNTHPNASIKITEDDALLAVSLTGFKSVTILKCPNLSSISLSDVEHLTINDVKLSSLDLRSCPNILDINVSNCTNMTSVLVRYEVRSELLSSMDISNTLINTLAWINENGLLVDIEGNIALTVSTGEINLVGAKGLTRSEKAFACANNTGVKVIRFDNTPTNLDTSLYLKDNLTKAIKIGSFEGCTKLTRIYGNVIVTSPSAFKDCYKFSIHGTDLSKIKYNNKSVISGAICYMPYQLLGNNINIVPNSLYFDNGKQSMDVYFLSGDDVTNMSFNITEFNQTFYNTSYTWWDVNYVLSNASPVFDGSDIKLINTFSLGAPHSGTNYLEVIPLIALGRNKVNKYNINRYLLHNVRIKEWTTPFDYIQCSEYKRLWSPTLKANGTFNKDGWATPLWECNWTTFSWLASSTYGYNLLDNPYGLKVAIDKNFFLGCPTSLVSVTNFYPLLVEYDDPLASISASSSNMGTGNANGLFDPILNLSSLYNVGFYYLNFNTLTIPDTVTKLVRAILMVYASGELNLNSIFKSTSKLTSITSESFIVTTSNANIDNAVFYIRNNSLDNLTYLTCLGGTENNDYRGTNNYGGCFKGSGLTKYIDASNFPYDVFKKHSNLSIINGFFTDVKELNGTNIIVPLPGRLFESVASLAYLPYCFYNVKFHYKLSSDGFAYNSNLVNLLHCFSNSYFYLDINATLRPCYLHGHIPYEFLKTPRESIVDLRYCFANSNWKYYENLNPTSVWDYDGVHGIGTYDTYDEVHTTSNWYDSKPIYVRDDYVLIRNYLNFCCAPDLLKYVASNCNVSYLFSGSGCPSSYGQVNSIDPDTNDLGTGLKGRIPPYLFKNPNGQGKITDTSYMFSSCLCISLYYTDILKNSSNTPISYKAHLIPLTLFNLEGVNVTTMTGMFLCTLMSFSEDLSIIFPEKTVNTSYMFATVKWVNYINGDLMDASCKRNFNYPSSNGIFKIAPGNISCMFIGNIDGRYTGSGTYNAATSYIELGLIMKKEFNPGTSVSYLFYGYDNDHVSGSAGDHDYISTTKNKLNYHYYAGEDSNGNWVYNRYDCITV